MRKGYWLLVFAGILSYVLVFVFAARGDESPFTPPEGAVKIGTIPLMGCPGVIVGYDTNKNLEDGAEFSLILDGGMTPRAALVFGPGDQGPLILATVRSSKGTNEVFLTRETLEEVYPSVCDTVKPIEKA
mgnify:CR=1 FL=1